MKEYAVTIKIQKTDRTYLACDYDRVIYELMEKQRKYGVEFQVGYQWYEFDSKKRLHYHGAWYTDRKPYFSKFNLKGCSCYMKDTYYSSGWFNYVLKNAERSEAMDFALKQPHEFKDPVPSTKGEVGVPPSYVDTTLKEIPR